MAKGDNALFQVRNQTRVTTTDNKRDDLYSAKLDAATRQENPIPTSRCHPCCVVVLDQQIIEDDTWKMHAKLCQWLGVGITTTTTQHYLYYYFSQNILT